MLIEISGTMEKALKLIRKLMDCKVGSNPKKESELIRRIHDLGFAIACENIEGKEHYSLVDAIELIFSAGIQGIVDNSIEILAKSEFSKLEK